jgi:hypothetical protein
MPTAIVTPAQLRVLARQLTESVGRITQRRKRSAAQVKDAAAVWKDEKYHVFLRTFDETVRQLGIFERNALKYAEFLEEKARAGEKYLRNR